MKWHERSLDAVVLSLEMRCSHFRKDRLENGSD